MQGSDMISFALLKEHAGSGGKTDVEGRARVEAGDQLGSSHHPGEN